MARSEAATWQLVWAKLAAVHASDPVYHCCNVVLLSNFSWLLFGPDFWLALRGHGIYCVKGSDTLPEPVWISEYFEGNFDQINTLIPVHDWLTPAFLASMEKLNNIGPNIKSPKGRKGGSLHQTRTTFSTSCYSAELPTSVDWSIFMAVWVPSEGYFHQCLQCIVRKS